MDKEVLGKVFRKEAITGTLAPQGLFKEYISFDRAVVCLDCEAIYDVSLSACPRCSGSHAHPLFRWVDSMNNRKRGSDV